MINISGEIKKWKEYTNLLPSLKEELDKMDENELQEAFYTMLEFGTGGMRGVMGPGINRMNIYTIRLASYSFGLYLKTKYKDDLKVAIAYDSRFNSLDFAKEASKVLATMNIKVYLFDKITPTPELSFCVRYKKCNGGIVITASHNPSKYNGFKVYDETGCQLLPDEVKNITKYFNDDINLFEIEAKDFDSLLSQGLIEYVNSEVDSKYLENVKSIKVNNVNKDNFKVVFTPLHGTSAYLGEKLLKELGYNYVTVKEQMIPDSKFSTVKLPNPEDKDSFNLAIKYAKDNNCDICIATDPDADRVGLACKHNNEFILLTGNQTGALLIDYLCNYKKINKQGYVFDTIVTSNFGSTIAKKHNMKVISTLTGFKYIGSWCNKLEKETDKEFFFGYEESYGYVISDFTRDKDSLQALHLCSEMACFYKNQNKTLIDRLEELYKEYGYFIDKLENIYLEGIKGKETINNILDYFRNSEVKIENVNIKTKEDYLLSYGINYDTNTKYDIDLEKSNVLKYILDDNSFFVLRPSGTEPKMKIYFSCNGKTKESAFNKINIIKDYIMSIVEKLK